MSAAATAAAVALSIVLPKLTALLQEEGVGFKQGAQDIMFLIDELRLMQDFLKVAGSERDPQVERYSRKLRDLSYEIEDRIDGFILHMECKGLKPHKSGSFAVRFMDLSTRAMHCHRFAKQLEELKSRLKEMGERWDRYKIHRVFSQARSVPVEDSRPPALDLDASSLVGVEDQRDELVQLLLKEEEETDSASWLRVVSIFGSGGLGKTTLAKEVYRTIQANFDCLAWVSMQPNRTVRNTLNCILRQVEDTHNIGGESKRNLLGSIKKCLQDKKYLLVLDGMRDLEAWEIISGALPFNSLGSRVITTTRSFDIAESCCSHWNSRIYDIRPLHVGDGRVMFHRRIFGSVGSCPSDLVDVADKIVMKCSGIPLAIATISSLLAYKPRTRSTWEDVHNSIGTSPWSVEGMRRIISLSYQDLPHHLKICLWHLGIFPEDYPINHDHLIRSWIAEGLVWQKPGRTIKEVAESYLEELTNRHMIQPIHGGYDGKNEAYTIYGMMLELIRSESVEESFVTLLDNGKPVSVLPSEIRRLSINNVNEGHDIPAPMAMPHLRSLCIFGGVGMKLTFKHLLFLRVLDLQGCKDLKNNNIEEIVGLYNLWYLSIRDTPISEIPDQICQLQYLTTLDIRGTEVQEFPTSVVQLRRLAHLLCDKMRFPEWIGKMTTLFCLSQFDILQSEMLAVEQLGNLSDLRELDFWWSPEIESNDFERYEKLVFSLYRLSKLQSLYINGSDSLVDFLDYLRHPLRQLCRIQLNNCYLAQIPVWFRSLESLTYLCIGVDVLKNEDLQLLSGLPSLLQLYLSSRYMSMENPVIPSNGFPVLRELHLCSSRSNLTFEPQAMHKLVNLFLALNVPPQPQEKYGVSIRVDQLRCLKKIDIRINGNGASAFRCFEATYAGIRKAAEEHPNRPMVNIMKLRNFINHAQEYVPRPY